METFEGRWKSLHIIAGIAAMAIALLLLGEVYVYSVIPNPLTTNGYLDLFLKNYQNVYFLKFSDALTEILKMFFDDVLVTYFDLN